MSEFHKKTTAQEMHDRKSAARRAVAALSVEEKFVRLVRLQEMASSVARAAGRESKEPWKIGR